MIRHGLALHIADNDLMRMEMPKWWWGFAYRKFNVRYTILYPIPLNLIVRYALKLYWLIYSWVSFGGWHNKLDDAYWMGFNDGRKETDAHMDRLGKIIVDSMYGNRKQGV